MNLFGVMHVSGAGLAVQRIRAEVVATNMANAETTRTEDGTPYQRRQVVIEAGEGTGQGQGGGFGQGTPFLRLAGGAANGMSAGSAGGFGASFRLGESRAGGSESVHIAGVVPSSAPPLQRYDPTHPDADASGFVSYPDINPLTEMVDLIGASRAYSLNASALQAEKGMLTASLDLLK